MALPDFYSQWTQARQNGAQRANDYTVRQNIGGALQGDSGALSAILKASPDTGMKLQSHVQGQQSAQREDAGKVASMFAQTGDPQYYAMWKQSLAGLPNAPQLPDALTPEDIEPAKQSAMAFAQAYGGMSAKDSTPSAIRELQMLSQNPELAKLDMQRRQAGFGRPQLIPTADGYAWATPEGASPLNYGGGGSSTPESPQVQRALAMLAGTPGVTMTSGMRTPERNRQVGGVPNSQHLSGTAGDYAVPPEQKAAFMAQARQQGFEAIDEGDHVHLELPRGSAGGQRVMPAPKQNAQSEIERRIGLARQMGASDAEVRQMIIGREGAAAGAKPMPASALKMIQEETNAANTASAINTSLDKHLSRIGSKKLEFGMVSNLVNKGKIAANLSDAEARNYQEFVSDLEKLRNDSLRLNSGVQTDGDAQRAWNELVANLNDTDYVKQRLVTIKELNQRAERLRRANVDMIRENYGRSEPQAAAPQQSVKRARNPQTGETLVLVNGQWVPE
jgi:hypothetical protein